MIRAYFFAALVFFLPLPAHAVCTGPAGDGGDVLYNTDHRTLQWCDGAQWIAFPWPERNESSTLPDPGSSATFGNSVALDGTTALVGSPHQGTGGTAYVFDVTTGSLSTAIGNPIPAIGDNFGESIALSGTTAVVGVPRDDPGGISNAGTAYVFDTTTGGLFYTLLQNPSPTLNDHFGTSVAVDGNLAVVGAHLDDPGGMSSAGSAYVFNATTGSLIATLNNPSPAGGDYFGYSVAVSGNTAVIGAYRDDPGGVTNAGTAYVFNATTGALTATLNNPSPTASDSFGRSVAVDGTTAVIGAYRDDPGGVNGAGAAYVFDTTTGNLTATLISPEPQAFADFGFSVAIEGNTVLVGQELSNSTRAYLFSAATGAFLDTLHGLTSFSGDHMFGYSLAVSGNTAIVGTPLEDDEEEGGGGPPVLVFTLDSMGGPSCNGAGDSPGDILYNAANNVLQWCRENEDWIGLTQPPLYFSRYLENPAPDANDNYGISVALDGTTAVIGADGDNPGGINGAGRARVFDIATGALISTLDNPSPDISDRFGVSVAIDGTTAVVGAERGDTGAVNTGTAYVFNTTTGNMVSTLANPTPASLDSFGVSVDVDGSAAIVGAPQDDPGGVNSAGTAYVFNANTGALTATLNNPSPTAGDRFGQSVALSGNLAVVGAYLDDPGGGLNAGTAYVFNASTGALIATLNNPAPASSDLFGYDVAVDGTRAVVGAYSDDPGGVTNAGSAYVFNANTGALISTLNNPAPATNDNFGWRVEISGTTAIVGAHRDNPGGVGDAGTAYVFDAATGNLLYTLDNPGPDRTDNFGESVAISGATAIVGAPEDGLGGTASVFLMDGTLGTAPCTAPSGEPGDMLYNADYAVLQWCNGADWIGLPKP